MKAFAFWILIFAALFGGLSLLTHMGLSAAPTRIVISIDDSYYMKDFWPRIGSRLKEMGLENRRYTEYFFLSNKEKISRDWEKDLNLTRFSQTRLFIGEYPARDLVDSAKYPELKQADIIYVVTASEDTEAVKKNKKAVLIKP